MFYKKTETEICKKTVNGFYNPITKTRTEALGDGYQRINRNRFYELVNKHYKKTTLSWSYFGEDFQTLDSFENLADFLKIFAVKERSIVAYQGKIYKLYLIQNNKVVLKKLVNNNDKIFIRTSYKNIKPIYNKTKKTIC